MTRSSINFHLRENEKISNEEVNPAILEIRKQIDLEIMQDISNFITEEISMNNWVGFSGFDKHVTIQIEDVLFHFSFHYFSKLEDWLNFIKNKYHKFKNNKRRRPVPPRDKLKYDVSIMPIAPIAKKYNTANWMIKVWCKKMNIEMPKQGHWNKKENRNWKERIESESTK